MEGIELFDSRFFRISPIEARLMDPRQRMMLETSWQALEDAGMDPDRLRGNRTGIYAGISASEYRDLMKGGDYGVSYLGTAGSMTVGRVSFALGLEGLTIPVELNCASSLVAVHYAVAALVQGEVDMALVGGAQAVLSPELTWEMAELGMLSASGRCRAFDAAADGFVRGEGCGMVVLKRLSAAVYGREREADRPLLIGSVKTNIGHLEAAAGVASLIKKVLAMNRGVIPKNLHFRDPNPNLDWDQLPIRVVSAKTDWPSHDGRPPRAGVSAFGISGTNSHVVVEGYLEEGRIERSDGFLPAGAPRPAAVCPPESPADRPPDEEGELRVRDARLLPLSGKAEGALRALAGAYLSRLEERAEELDDAGAACSLLADMAWTACLGRSHFNFRAGLVFHDIESLRDGLKTVAEADDWPQSPPAAKVAFAFAGEGSEWVGMGKELYDSEPVARGVLDRCDAVLREERGDSLLDVTFGRVATEKGLDDPAGPVRPGVRHCSPLGERGDSAGRGGWEGHWRGRGSAGSGCVFP